jgi:hypothetical protein
MSLYSIHRHSRVTTTRSLGPFGTMLLSARMFQDLDHAAPSRCVNNTQLMPVQTIAAARSLPLCLHCVLSHSAPSLHLAAAPTRHPNIAEYHVTAPSENNHYAGSHASASPLITTAVTLQPPSIMVSVIKRWLDAA